MTTATSASTINYWPDNACARAFWGQQELPPYRELLADTTAWMDVAAGQRWLDLGCGSGQLTRALWEKSGGQVEEIVALDCAAANGRALRRLAQSIQPPDLDEHLHFLHADFSHGLAQCPDDSFAGVVSGLAIHYAESYDPTRRCWTTAAYERLLDDVYRVLQPGGQFVFSVCVPDPTWLRVAFSAIHGFFLSRNPFKYLKNAYRMMRYGGWLKQQARLGRFHYLPADRVAQLLRAAGFVAIEHRLSFARQAYLVRCRKPA